MRNDGMRDLGVGYGRTLPIRSRVIGKVNSPGVLLIKASQIVPLMRGLASRFPLANERMVSSKPSGSAT